MNSGQGVLWIILWICLNSELLRYHGVQNFAKNDTENVKLALRLRQSVFCINAKTCPLRTWTKRFRGAAPEDTHGNPSPGVLLFFHSAPYFILVSGEAAAVPGRVPAPRDR